jgi:aminoglycoside 6-adenylyltransferase
MAQTTFTYDQLIGNFVTWAQGEPNIRAALVIGSQARVERPADEWSDLDIVLIASDIERYVAKADWLEAIGKPLLTFFETTPAGDKERRTLFEGGLDVDFALIPRRIIQQLRYYLQVRNRFPLLLRLLPRKMTWQMQQEAAEFAAIIDRGVRLLVDKDGITATMSLGVSSTPLYQPPSQAEFLNVVNDFWYHTLWTAKHLRRGELWWAKSCCDGYLKERLRWILEWQARAMHGPDHDTWMRGRFLEQWADPRAVSKLKATYAHYDEEDTWQALFATMDLFRWLSLETAEKLGFPYPTYGAEQAAEMTKRLYEEKRDA